MKLKIKLKYHEFMYKLKGFLFGYGSAKTQKHLGNIASIGFMQSMKKGMGKKTKIKHIDKMFWLVVVMSFIGSFISLDSARNVFLLGIFYCAHDIASELRRNRGNDK